MTKPTRPKRTLVAPVAEPLAEEQAMTPEEALPALPAARFFGVPFLKGLAQAVTAIHLCPERVYLASIRDGSDLQVANRLTRQILDLGELACASMVAFRPRVRGVEAVELAMVGPEGRGHLVRYDLQGGRSLPGLPFQAATALQYSADGQFVAAGSRTGQVRVWHLGPEGPVTVLEASVKAEVESLAFQSEHPTLYAVLVTGALVELPLAPGLAASAVAALEERAPGVRFLRVTAGRNGYPIYLAGQDQQIYVVDTATGAVGVFAPNVGPITSLQVLPASGHLCVTGLHAVYVLKPVGAGPEQHLGLLCPFDEPIYAAWELGRDTVLVFHAA
jgi:hypothetical protein